MVIPNVKSVLEMAEASSADCRTSTRFQRQPVVEVRESRSSARLSALQRAVLSGLFPVLDVSASLHPDLLQNVYARATSSRTGILSSKAKNYKVQAEFKCRGIEYE